MKRITHLLTAVAAVATLAVQVKAAADPLSAGALGFLAWGLSPYVYMLVLNRWMATRQAIIAMAVVAVVACAIGVWLPVDALFLHPDAQGGLAFLFAPLWQWFLLLIATIPLYLLNRTVPLGPRGP